MVAHAVDVRLQSAVSSPCQSLQFRRNEYVVETVGNALHRRHELSVGLSVDVYTEAVLRTIERPQLALHLLGTRMHYKVKGQGKIRFL